MNGLKKQFTTRWPIAACILISFVGGYGISFVARKDIPLTEARIQIADFRVDIPEGQTVVTITDRGPESEELGRLSIVRHGDKITGVPEIRKSIAPREPLTADDVTFFRGEIQEDVSLDTSPWERANKIRQWLSRRCYRFSYPGLETRVAREAYEQMKDGKPVLCGNLAEMYVAFCEAMGLTARVVGLGVAVQNGLFNVDTHAGAEVWLFD